MRLASRETSRRPRTGACTRRGSVLVPAIAAMLVLLFAGLAVAELHGARARSSALELQSAQAYWAAEAATWYAAEGEAGTTSPVTFAGASLTATKDGNTYTGTATLGTATRTFGITFATRSTDAFGGWGLIGHWAMDEDGGSTIADSVGGNTGTLATGAQVGEDGLVDDSVRFDGMSGYAVIPHSSDYLVDEGTFQAWIFPEEIGGARAFISKDSTNYGTGGHLNIRLNGSIVEARLQSTDQSYTLSSGSVVQIGRWLHVAVTFGPAGFYLYLDGAEADSSTYTGALATSSGGDGNFEPIVLGATSWGSADLSATPVDHYFKGKLDAFAIYDIQLSAAEIAALYDAGGVIE